MPGAARPLAILALGQLFGSMALGSQLVPMMFAGRLLTTLAAVTLLVKGALLFPLVPRLTLTGAAIATAVGTIVAQQGQAIAAARRLGVSLRPAGLLALVAVAAVGAATGHAALVRTAPGASPLVGALAAAGAALAPILLLGWWLLAPDERAALRRLSGVGPAASGRG